MRHRLNLAASPLTAALLLPFQPAAFAHGTLAAAKECHGLTATIVGTDRKDTIEGTDGDDVIAALGGNDTINAGAGNDVICDGGGEDTIDDGPGDDIVDLTVANPPYQQSNRVLGSAGDDRVVGTSDDSVLELDYSASSSGIAVDADGGLITGDATGTDTVTKAYKVIGTPQADTLDSNNGARLFIPPNFPYLPSPTFAGMDGDDVVRSAGTRVWPLQIDGGSGNDRITVSHKSAISTGLGDDVLRLGDARQEVAVDGGEKDITMGGGNDQLGKVGTAITSGTIDMGSGDDRTSEYDHGWNARYTLRGGPGNDTLYLGNQGSTDLGPGGDDVAILPAAPGLVARLGPKTVTAPATKQQIAVKTTFRGQETVTSRQGGTVIYGSPGPDRIVATTLGSGFGSPRAVYGGRGNDDIRNHGATTYSYGGPGNDTMGLTIPETLTGGWELLDGGTGFNRLDLTKLGGVGGLVTVNLRKNLLENWSFSTVVRNFNSVLTHADRQTTVIGTDDNDRFEVGPLHPGTGEVRRPVRFLGRGGHDVLIGGLADDFLDGGTGTDRADGKDGKNKCPNVENRTKCVG